MSLDIPGQKTVSCARLRIPETPWWTEWRACSMWPRRAWGTTILESSIMTPSTTVSRSLFCQYTRRDAGRECLASGNPCDARVDNCWRSWSAWVACCIATQMITPMPLAFDHRPTTISDTISSSAGSRRITAKESTWSGLMGSSPAGLRDVASSAGLAFPGTCVMRKRHIIVRCFNRNSRGLVMASSRLSPRILVSGLWSVTTTRLVHPMVNHLVSSSAHATARHSPSMGGNASLRLAGNVSLLAWFASRRCSNPVCCLRNYSVSAAASSQCPCRSSLFVNTYWTVGRRSRHPLWWLLLSPVLTLERILPAHQTIRRVF